MCVISAIAVSRLRCERPVRGRNPVRATKAAMSASLQVARMALPMPEQNAGTRPPGAEIARMISRLPAWLRVISSSRSSSPRLAVSRVASRSRRRRGSAGATKLCRRPKAAPTLNASRPTCQRARSGSNCTKSSISSVVSSRCVVESGSPAARAMSLTRMPSSCWLSSRNRPSARCTDCTPSGFGSAIAVYLSIQWEHFPACYNFQPLALALRPIKWRPDMTQYVDRHGLSVAEPLADLIENDVLTDVSPDRFWSGYAALLRDLAPQNAALLAKRANLQRRIDDWHIARRGQPFDGETYRAFLTEIGYLEPEPGPFAMSTENVDPEIASIAGPQLVVPVMNARFALNAANARWESLYDALYGTDAIEGEPQGRGYDAARGAQVIAWTRAHLDDVTPLDEGSWTDVSALAVRDGGVCVTVGETETTLADAEQFAGYTEAGNIFLRAHGLLIEVVIDRTSAIGKNDPAGIADIRLESALTAIQDCEDSVAAVDAEDKCVVYANWLGLMGGDLEEMVDKCGK